MAVIGTFACLWSFLRTADFSIHDFVQVFGVWVMAIVPLCFLAMDFKKIQFVELTDEGVASLVWAKPITWPRLERFFLKWTDVQKIEVRANFIYLHGAQHRVVINTFLFKDANEVIKFINKASGSAGSSYVA